MGNRCMECLLERSGQPCVLYSGLGPADDLKDDHLQVQNHHYSTIMARDVLVLEPGGSVHKTPF